MNAKFAAMVRALAFAAAIAIFANCGKRALQPGDPIKKFGKYAVGALKIHVSESPKGILRYSVKQNGRELLSSTNHHPASIHQRWFLVLDERNRLWVSSSDIGSVVWLPNQNKSYSKVEFANGDPLLKEMPPSFEALLPSGAKKALGL